MSKKYYFEHFVFFQILLETLAPCKSIARLPNTIFRGMSSANRNATHQTFTILPQSTTHVKIFFYGKYCMDVHMRAEGLISIRDGAYSRYFKIFFLSLFVFSSLIFSNTIYGMYVYGFVTFLLRNGWIDLVGFLLARSWSGNILAE